MPDHDGNRTNDLWNAIANVRAVRVFDISKLRLVPLITSCVLVLLTVSPFLPDYITQRQINHDTLYRPANSHGFPVTHEFQHHLTEMLSNVTNLQF